MTQINNLNLVTKKCFILNFKHLHHHFFDLCQHFPPTHNECATHVTLDRLLKGSIARQVAVEILMRFHT